MGAIDYAMVAGKIHCHLLPDADHSIGSRNNTGLAPSDSQYSCRTCGASTAMTQLTKNVNHWPTVERHGMRFILYARKTKPAANLPNIAKHGKLAEGNLEPREMQDWGSMKYD